MTKKKKNIGITNLQDLNIQDISSTANLKENFIKKDSLASKKVIKSLEIPAEFDMVIREAKANKKIIGSMNAYIIEALRRRMLDEGLI